MTFLDTGILVGSVLASHPDHKACASALRRATKPFTDAHALAETFATLNGFYRVPSDLTAELTFQLQELVTVTPLTLEDYQTAIRESRSRGVTGGGIYDSLHATFARREKASVIITRNPSDFHHVAPDIEIQVPN